MYRKRTKTAQENTGNSKKRRLKYELYDSRFHKSYNNIKTGDVFLIDLMFETPDKKDLEKIVINRDVVSNKSDPILIYSNKQTNQKILANKS